MRPVVGVDLNGVRDAIAKHLGEQKSGEFDENEEIDLGIRSSLIALRAQEGRWLGGAQTAQAPHGRGAGWGAIGAESNRIDLLDLLNALAAGEPQPDMEKAVASALPDLIGDSELAVFAVPDAPNYDEAFRDRLLRILQSVVGLRPLLLWRPVAALLGWIAASPAEARASSSVAVLSLMADGVHASVLTVEQDIHRDVPLLVPQRNWAGASITGSFSGARLIEAGRNFLLRETRLPIEEIRASAMAPWLAAVGVETKRELMRLPNNRGWVGLPKVDLPCPAPDPGDLFEAVADRLSRADLLLVEGPFAGNAPWRAAVLGAISDRVALPPEVAPGDFRLVARGCMEAATRHLNGQPIYFDFLPQLQINAMVGDAPRFVDLTQAGARCRGGEPYRAQAQGAYVIGKGATHLTFWLFKEDLERGRRAEAELPQESDEQYQLAVSVEQIPGQGFAKVQISSPHFEALRRSPITLDWKQMEEIGQTREEILAELAGQTGLAWPDTAVKPGHPFQWLPEHPSGNLMEQLADYCAVPLIDGRKVKADARRKLQTLRQRFSRPDTPSFLGRTLGLNIAEQGGFRALDSDGNLPEPASGLTVPQGAAEALDATLAKLDEDLVAVRHCLGSEIDQSLLGDIFGFASWCFWRCPPSIASVLLDTYCGDLDLDVQFNLLREGVARVVSATDQLEHYLNGVERRLRSKSRLTAAEYAGLARVLGTSEEAAALLDHTLANHILQLTIEDFALENRSSVSTAYKRRFKAALLMLAGLLRHREATSTFLDPDRHAARSLLTELRRAEDRNRDFGARSQAQGERSGGQNRAKYLAAARRFLGNADIIGELIAFVHEQGRDPNIIRRIDALDDD